MTDLTTVEFLTTLAAATVRLAVPVMFAGLGETIAEKTGILNIGIEGVMLSGAFFAFAGAWYSKSLMAGILCGMLGGIFISSIHGFLSINMAKDQTVSGLALNIFALGFTSYFFKLMQNGSEYQQIDKMEIIKIPVLSKLPVLGQAFFAQDILTYSIYVLMILAFIFYRKTNLGLSFFAIGENPKAAASVGIPVHKYQWISVILNGILGGIGGANLVLVQLGVFNENMTSGRGYIALAAVILGRYSPVGVFAAALLFGTANALQIRLQTIGISISPYILAMLPYAATLFAMLFASGKNNKPKSLAVPFIKGSR